MGATISRHLLWLRPLTPRLAKGDGSNRGDLKPEGLAMREPLIGASDAAEAGSTGRYAITVSFKVRNEARAKFLALVAANASASVELEPGCRRFDVLVPCDADPSEFVLYEIYDDREAFEAHMTSEHFLAFDHATRAFVTSKVVVEFKVIENAKP
jgi:(4S)-4-hydroxy-5-phosphonooxypentane-2,3-dione isomerase